MIVPNERLTRTVDEAARIIGISRNSAWAAVWSGQLRSVRVGKRVLEPMAAIEQLLGKPESSVQ